MKISTFLKILGRDASGATAVEYGLILSMIFLAMLGAVQSFGNEATGMWNLIAEKVAANNGQ